MKRIYVFLLTIIILLFFKENFINKTDNTAIGINKIKFFNREEFSKSLIPVESSSSLPDSVKGVIIPHHQLVGNVIADFFNKISFQNPSTIILIGPNHKELGEFNSLTSLNVWKTEFGTVYPNDKILNGLMKKSILREDNNVIENDQSISTLIPYISYFLPDAKVVPVVLKRKLSVEESRILAENITDIIDNDTIIVASVDFSHYLNIEESKKMDDITLKIINNFDYKKLFKLNSDYLDSPSSIGVLLMSMQNLNANKSKILFHGNSGEILEENNIPTTSYFEIVFF